MPLHRKLLSKILPPEGGRFTGKMLIALILPLIAEQFLAIMVGMADTVMVTGAGENAVSAVSLVDTLNVLLIQIFAAIGAGGSVIAAQYLGKGDRGSACRAAKQLLVTSLALSLLIAVPSALFRSPVLRGLYSGAEEDILRQSEVYFLISALSYPALALYNGGVGLLRAMGDSKASMKTSIIMNVINIIGNAILIYGFKMGVAGAAIASLFSRIVAAVIILRMLLDRSMPIHLENPLDLRPEFSMIRRITAVGVPNGLENSLFQVGKLIIARVLASLPSAMIAANAICNSISGVVNVPGNSVGLAALTIIGQCVGAGDEKQAKEYGNRLLWWMFLIEVPTNLALFFFPGLLIRFFAVSQEVSALSVEILRLYGLMCFLLWAFSFGLPCVLRAAGDVKYSMMVSMVSMLVLRLGLSYLFVYVLHLQLHGIWLAMYCDWVARAAFFVWRYLNGKWLKHKLI